MGRGRKRSNSDHDESLEERFSQYKSQPRVDNHPGSEGEVNVVAKNTSKVLTTAGLLSKKPRLSPLETTPNSSSDNEVVSTEESQRIQRLRQLKKRRKRQKEAKILKKKEISAKQPTSQNSSKAGELEASPCTKKKDDPNTEFKSMGKGIQYRDVSIGKGSPVQERKKIRVSYVLRSQHRYGKILDSSNDFRFRLGRGEVIKGWDLGIMGMRQGGKRYLIVPPNVGYGGRDVGAGKGGLLFFEISVLDC